MTVECAKTTGQYVRFAFLLALATVLVWDSSAQAQNIIVEQMVRECKAGCMETIRDTKNPEVACSHWCWCMFTDKQSKTVEESKQRCAAEYHAKGNNEILTRHQVEPAHLVLFETVKPRSDENMVRTHFDNEPRLKTAKLLSCVYGSVGVYFWYKKVPITRKELLAVHARHPMRTLGDVALTTCPKTLTEAENHPR
jgi:hypothetical protein